MICTIILLLFAFTGSVFGGTEGTINTFYGTAAGANTSGDDDNDTFIGAYAGFSNTSGNYNTFLGFAAGYFNTTGADNTFIGLNAGYKNTTGYMNTFIGGDAGWTNTTGNDNTFIGYEAGYNNTTGYENTFLGNGAGYNNTTGNDNTFIGSYVGLLNTTGAENIFLGAGAGYYNTTGYENTFLGRNAGYYNTTGYMNTFLGWAAGYNNTTGSGNIFLGPTAGLNEPGSNKLYIDNSDTSTPLIYGEFDTRNLTIYGNLEVIGPYQGLVYLSNTTADNTNKVSRMVLNHYSNAELPLYLFGAASTDTNNFVAFGGGNTIGNAATQIDLFTAENTTTPVGTSRITIKGNGYIGIGTQSPSNPLEMASGAYVTTGGVWTNASSREYKDNIEALATEEALDTLKELNPVKFAYKKDMTEKHVGFVAEDVPDLVATKDRKGLSPMDIVAVLTKVVQEQQKTNQVQQTMIKTLMEKLAQLEVTMADLRARGNPLPILFQK